MDELPDMSEIERTQTLRYYIATGESVEEFRSLSMADSVYMQLMNEGKSAAMFDTHTPEEWVALTLDKIIYRS